MLRLVNASRGYDWGSTADIPRFLGEVPDGKPVAEVWIGTHPLAPSTDDDGTSLQEAAGELPFLVKLLAADRPLSLQVHPNRAMAREGFAAEEAAGIPLDAPDRTYKDPHHKPEMAYALTTFDTLVGFRPTAEILRVLIGLNTTMTRKLAENLNASPGFPGIVKLVEQLLAEPPSVDEIAEALASCRELTEQGIDIKRAYVTALEIADYYPEDVGVIISMMLNRLTLQPGEAAFLGTGIIHSHLKGLCLEVMASSDNVLRAGLTSKSLDPAGLVRCLGTGMSRLARVTPEPFGFSTSIFSPDVDEFALAVSQCSDGYRDHTPLPPGGKRILVCTGGEVVVVNSAGERIVMARGDSVYAGPEDGALTIEGTGEVAQAYQPTSDTVVGELIDLVPPYEERMKRSEQRLTQDRRDRGPSAR
ncbi:mannose-6-phosphate isomerase, class I [Aeromicrobium panaciterrae]|uniref:mannose-6-phosphate isomerase, class I n=1 Tax=Aeromicrobium panaciterrae TaxID=363861 RepID=UPI0031E46EA0